MNALDTKRNLLRREVYNRFFTITAGGVVSQLTMGTITFTPSYTWRITSIQVVAIFQPAAGPYVATSNRISISNAGGYAFNKQLDNQVDALVPGFAAQTAFFGFGPSTAPRLCDIEISAGVTCTLQGFVYANFAVADQADVHITMDYEVYNTI